MRAHLKIVHRAGSVQDALTAAFGAHSDEALRASAFAKETPGSAKSINYAARTPEWIVLAWSTEEVLHLYVESRGGQLRSAAVEVWDHVRRGLRKHKPRLETLALVDELENDVITSATVGMSANIRRAEFLITAITGITTGAVILLAALGVFGLTLSTDLLVGSLPAIVAAIITSGVVLLAVKSKRLIWD